MNYILIALVFIMAGSSGMGGFFILRGRRTAGRICSFLFAVSALVYGFTQGNIFNETGIIVLSLILVAGIIGSAVGAATGKQLDTQ